MSCPVCPRSPSCRTARLLDCGLDDAAIASLGAGPARNGSLRELTLDGNDCCECAGLAASPSLRTLSLRRLGRATPETARALGLALRTNATLARLRLSSFAQIYVQELRGAKGADRADLADKGLSSLRGMQLPQQRDSSDFSCCQ